MPTLRTSFFLAVAVALLVPQVVAARTIGLLVGVGRYTSAPPLAGPEHDVPAVRDLLIRHMGARDGDIVILQDQAATAIAIRRELRALMARSQPGDKVVIYFSGHGTSGRDPLGSNYNLPDGTGAFVPFDVGDNPQRPWRERLIVGRFDLRPLALEPLDKGGREVLLIMDSCYSGNAVRGGLKSGITYRYAALGAETDPLLTAATAPMAAEPPNAYPYRRVSMLAASAETEKAADLPGGMTLSGKAQGALTDALMRLFAGNAAADFDRDGQVTLVEAARGVSTIMTKSGLSQTPQLLPTLESDPVPALNAPVPGMPALPVTAEPLVVALPASDAALARQLQSAGITTRTSGGGDLVVEIAGSGRNLRNRAGDLILGNATAAQIMARARAQQWVAVVMARASLAVRAELTPAGAGGTFVIDQGKAITLALTAKRTVQPLVIDVAPNGNLVMLYPTAPHEVRSIPADARTVVADTPPIVAKLPAGTDHMLVIGLESPPSDLARWFSLDASIDSSDGRAFTQWLAGLPGAIGATGLDLRTITQ